MQYDWNAIREYAEAGNTLVEIHRAFGVSHVSVRKKAGEEQWKVPFVRTRESTELVKQKAVAQNQAAVAKAELKLREAELKAMENSAKLKKAEDLISLAEQAKSTIVHGAAESLKEFFRGSPVPETFKDAKIAQEMLQLAMGEQKDKPTINIGFLLPAALRGDSHSTPVVVEIDVEEA